MGIFREYLRTKTSPKTIKMASNRPTGFGLSRELAEKNAAKYSQDDEVEIVEWVCAYWCRCPSRVWPKWIPSLFERWASPLPIGQYSQTRNLQKTTRYLQN